MTLTKPQALPLGLPQGSVRSEGQGLPQGKPLPYSLSLSLSLLPVFSPSIVRSPRGARTSGDGWMVASGTGTVTRDDTVTGLDVIEGIDLDADVPCEYPTHEWWHKDEPASYIVRTATCPSCGRSNVSALCRSGWEKLSALTYLHCPRCEYQRPPSDFMRIIEVLR